MADNSIASNRSTLKEFLASIATIQGDLSNITAPPFVLAEHSTVEIPQYWTGHPSLFVAPAHGKSAEERALLVLKRFLGSLKKQQYAGRDPSDGVKKPLNAFLGELFLGSWNDDRTGETRLVSEQVSHHPPVTACYLWNDKHGVRAEGFTCQEITFSGSVSIKQKGYAIMRIDEYEEDYLIPMPNVKVKGILSGTPYPELTGTYSVVASTGFVSEVKFEGKGLFSTGSKNSFEAKLFHVDRPNDTLYTASGQWSHSFTINDKSGKEIETYDVNADDSRPITTEDNSIQDPWESRRAWGDVLNALNQGDMQGTTDAKSIIEEGQRKLRKEEDGNGTEWKRVFFRRYDSDPVFEKLSSIVKDKVDLDHEGGIWKIDNQAVANAKKPYHGDLLPTGERSSGSTNGANVQDTRPQERTIDAGRQNEDIFSGNQGEESGAGAVNGHQIAGAPTPPATNGDDIEKEKLDKIQVEEFLRAKYSNAR